MLNSLREKNEDEDEDEENKTLNNLTEAIEITNHYEKILKTQHKRITQYIYEQGEIHEMFKGTEHFFDSTRQIRSMVYFKNAVLTSLKKLKKSTFSSS